MTRTLFALLLFALPAQAQIIFPAVVPPAAVTTPAVYDSVFGINNMPDNDSNWVKVVVGSDADRVMAVHLTIVNKEGAPHTTAYAKRGSQVVTWVDSVSEDTNYRKIYLGYVVAPTTGEDTLYVVFSKVCASHFAASTWHNASQSDPIGARAKTIPASIQYHSNSTTKLDNAGPFNWLYYNEGGVVTGGSGQTQRLSIRDSWAFTYSLLETKSSSASVAFTDTLAGGQWSGGIASSVNPK